MPRRRRRRGSGADVAARTHGASGADLAALVREAALCALRRHRHYHGQAAAISTSVAAVATTVAAAMDAAAAAAACDEKASGNGSDADAATFGIEAAAFIVDDNDDSNEACVQWCDYESALSEFRPSLRAADVEELAAFERRMSGGRA